MRKKREYSERGFYHVVIRGVNKQNIFFDDNDKILFINLLKKYGIKLKIRIHAYCLMDNHVHLELEDLEHNLSVFMQSICSIYARSFNRKYDRIGHLFQDRFASEIINNTKHFLTVFRYIMQNHKKAGLSSQIQFRWNSYTHYSISNTFVYKEFLLEYFGSLTNIYRFLLKESDENCLEIELRPSEKEMDTIEKIKKLLKTENPLIPPDLPRNQIEKKIRLLKENGFSIRTISRITGISKYQVQIA